MKIGSDRPPPDGREAETHLKAHNNTAAGKQLKAHDCAAARTHLKEHPLEYAAQKLKGSCVDLNHNAKISVEKLASERQAKHNAATTS